MPARRARSLRTRPLLLALAAGAGLSLAAPQAQASPDDDWANVEIGRTLAARAREEGARPAYRGSVGEDDEVRPQRRGRPERRQASRRSKRAVKVASLAPTPAPSPARQSSVSAPPRPQAEIEAEAAAKPRKDLGPMVASLGRDFLTPPEPQLPSLFGGPIRWVASSDCLVKVLQGVLGEVAAAFGPVQVNSTCRSPRHNRRVGGARRSWHLTGSAADFRIGSNPKAVLAFLRKHKQVGGLKHYGRGVFHIDIGPRRTW